MSKQKLDLSVKSNALGSMNATAISGQMIMNTVIALAYLIELIKGMRSPLSYAIVAVLCFLPCILCFVAYSKKKDSAAVRYIYAIGFGLLYAYVMFTTSTNMTFSYIIVAFVMLMVFMDVKLLTGLGVAALVVNIVIIVRKAIAKELVGKELTEAEIVLACLLLTGFFTMLALRKINEINQANIERAELERQQSEGILNTTLEVAASMTESIRESVEETENLKEAIGATKAAMEELNNEAESEAKAIALQKESTNRINTHVREIETAVGSIVSEVDNAEENLNKGNEVMKELLHQVQVSENTGKTAAEKMEELKANAARMQDIMGLISNIADQTGLLALNASIEAARAGEAGRGFSVVASEISNLSSQTNSATEDINGLIKGIVGSIEAMTESMELLLESSRLQNQYVDDTANNFEKLHQSTQGIFSQVSQLKTTVDVVTEENSKITEGILNVEEVTQKVLVGTNDTLADCNTNLQSVANVVDIMDRLMEDAGKLQTE